MKVLEVVCGSGKSISFNPYFRANFFVDVEKPTQTIENFIVADICHLPFNCDFFYMVYSRHVLEHTDNPIKALKELIRVSKKYVVVITLHRYSVGAKQPKHHKSFFNVKWFGKVLIHLNVQFNISISYCHFKYLPSNQWFNEIIVCIGKGNVKT